MYRFGDGGFCRFSLLIKLGLEETVVNFGGVTVVTLHEHFGDSIEFCEEIV